MNCAARAVIPSIGLQKDNPANVEPSDAVVD
jgi:hypothetical protein